MKTLIGNNNWLYLISEVEQHYVNNLEISNTYYPKITEYLNGIRNMDNNFLMFIVPDKSVICTENLPKQYNIENKFRLIDNLKKKYSNIIDIHDANILSNDDYFHTDTHINYNAGLKISKLIIS